MSVNNSDTAADLSVPRRVPPARRRALYTLLVLNGVIAVVGITAVQRTAEQSRRTVFTATTASVQSIPSATPTLLGGVPLKTYASHKLHVSFTYPADWEITDRQDSVLIQSPQFALSLVEPTFPPAGAPGTPRSVPQQKPAVIRVALDQYFPQGGPPAGGLRAVADSVAATLPTPGLNGHITSYVSYVGLPDSSIPSFTGFFLDPAADYRANQLVDTNNAGKYTPNTLHVSGEYIDLAQRGAGGGPSLVPLDGYDRPAAFQQAIAIAESVHATP